MKFIFKIPILCALAATLLAGTCDSPTPCPPVKPCPCDSTVTPPPPPLDTAGLGEILIGINSNHYQPKERQAAFQGVRLYYPIAWGQTELGFRGQPMLQAQKQFLGIDEYLLYMKSQGVDVLLTLMQGPGWLNGQEGLTNDYPPIRPGLNRTDPKSYVELANIYKGFAIRYGKKNYPPGSYKIDTAPPRWNGDGPQVHKSGLDLLEYIEVQQEADCWWHKGTPKYMTPQEHAAMLITVYDSIKAVSDIKVVLAGLTNFDLPYLREMQAFCTSRGRAFPVDVINLHHYSSLGNLPGVHPPTWLPNQAAAPELDKDFSTVAQVVAWAGSIGKPVWVSEYGYDTQPGSQMYVTPYAGLASEQIQAQMVVRATLEYLRMGVERTYLFTIADEPNPNGGTFTSSGVLYGEPRGYAPKPSFDAMASLCANLKGCTAVRDKSTPDVRVVEFDTPRGVVVYDWSPSASGKSFQATVNGKLVTVTETAQKQ